MKKFNNTLAGTDCGDAGLARLQKHAEQLLDNPDSLRAILTGQSRRQQPHKVFPLKAKPFLRLVKSPSTDIQNDIVHVPYKGIV